MENFIFCTVSAQTNFTGNLNPVENDNLNNYVEYLQEFLLVVNFVGLHYHKDFTFLKFSKYMMKP